MKIIFEDIDGVLNSTQSHFWYRQMVKNEDDWINYRGSDDGELSVLEKQLCPMACSNLKLILEKYPDVRIVISSTWRGSRSVEKFNKIFKYYRVFTEDKVIGKTPCLNKQRGYEIQDWIENNGPIDDFVILDDDSDMGPYLNTPHFIETNGSVGFDYLKMEEVDKHFGKFNIKFKDVEEGVPYRMFCKSHETLYYREGDEMFYFDNGIKSRGVFFYPEDALFSRVVS